MEDDTVTVRDRDSMQQVRMPVDRLVDELRARMRRRTSERRGLGALNERGPR